MPMLSKLYVRPRQMPRNEGKSMTLAAAVLYIPPPKAAFVFAKVAEENPVPTFRRNYFIAAASKLPSGSIEKQQQLRRKLSKRPRAREEALLLLLQRRLAAAGSCPRRGYPYYNCFWEEGEQTGGEAFQAVE